MNTNRFVSPSRQSGVALVVVLILLLVMTLLALASVRGTVMEERMSSNQFDRSLAFQAAEAALREGEAVAATKPTLPASGCTNGLCAKPDPAAASVWLADSVWATAPEAIVKVGDLTAKPKYIIELLANNVPAKGSCTTTGDVSADTPCTGSESRYRITARSQAADRAEVMLQSNFAVP